MTASSGVVIFGHAGNFTCTPTMKSGICTKCGSTEVYFSQRREDGTHMTIGWFKELRFERYVCLSCGFTEEYVATADLINPTKLEEVRKSTFFKKVKE